MKTFIARQPLFNMKDEVVGYELLFRNSSCNEADVTDDYQATLKVAKDLIINFGVREIADTSRVFMKFNSALILDGLPDLFKSEKLVLELDVADLSAEGVEEKLLDYKSKGFLVATDRISDRTMDPGSLDMVDMVKVNFMKYEAEDIKAMVALLKPYKKVLVAEKVEDQEMHQLAKDLGFTIFQGYFYQRPILMESSETVMMPTVYIEMMQALNKEVVDFEALAEIIQRDSAITLSLLKLMNSAAYYSKSKVTSVKTALVRIGVEESRKILMINLLKSLSVDTMGNELINMSLKRGKMAESLASSCGLNARKDELFLVGLLSMINIIMGRPMSLILSDVPLAEDVINALLGDSNDLSDVIELIILHEMESYGALEQRLSSINVTMAQFNDVYMKALGWADRI